MRGAGVHPRRLGRRVDARTGSDTAAVLSAPDFGAAFTGVPRPTRVHTGTDRIWAPTLQPTLELPIQLAIQGTLQMPIHAPIQTPIQAPLRFVTLVLDAAQPALGVRLAERQTGRGGRTRRTYAASPHPKQSRKCRQGSAPESGDFPKYHASPLPQRSSRRDVTPGHGIGGFPSW